MNLADVAALVIDNEIEDATSDGIDLDGPSSFAGRNELDDVGGIGISVDAKSITVHRNDIDGCAAAGIAIDADDCVVSFNEVRKSGTFDIDDGGTNTILIKNDVTSIGP